MALAPFEHIRCPVLVLSLEMASLTGDDLAESLRDEMLACCRSLRPQHLILDLGKVSYMTSSGFRPLLSLLREMRSLGGRFLLCNLQPDVHEVLTVTRLISPDDVTPAPLEAHKNLAACLTALGLASSGS